MYSSNPTILYYATKKKQMGYTFEVCMFYNFFYKFQICIIYYHVSIYFGMLNHAILFQFFKLIIRTIKFGILFN